MIVIPKYDVHEHTEDCTAIGDEECGPVSGSWMQPDGCRVSEAQGQLGDERPWCQVRELAWKLSEEEAAS